MIFNFQKTKERPFGNIVKAASIQASHKPVHIKYHMSFKTYFAKNGVFLRVKTTSSITGKNVVLWYKQDPGFITLKGNFLK